MKFKWTIEEIESIGLTRCYSWNGLALDYWQMTVSHDCFFHFDQRDGILSCRASDGGDWSMVYDDISLEKFKALKDVLSVR